MSNKDLWVERYRPRTISDYVWASESMKQQVEHWISEGTINHTMLIGPPGTGKTSLVYMILELLGVDRSDIKYINGCTDNGVDIVRDLENFVSTLGSGDYRYVVYDEFDYVSHNAMAGLKNMMETYSSCARFLFTANLGHKIIPPIKSRVQLFEIQALDRQSFMARVATILMAEGVELDVESLDTLEDYVSVSYPDLRKCINLLQQNCVNGKLVHPDRTSLSSSTEYMIEAVNLFKSGKINEARKIISGKIQANEYEEFYRLLYRNLSWWGNTDDKQNSAIVTIANRLRDHTLVADPEINLSAALVELEMIKNGS
jgi:DNA polymerase III delta prime subunit